MREFNVYDQTLTRVGIIDTFVSLVWEEGYNTLGRMQMELQQKDGLLDILKIGYYIGRTDLKTVCMIRSVQVEGGTILVNGSPATRLLGDRVSTTKVAVGANAESTLRNVVSSMTTWPGVELGDAAGITDTYQEEFQNGSVLEYCERITQALDIGFILRHDRTQKKLLFELYKPTENKNLVFATKFGNMANVNFVNSDESYKNVAIVVGKSATVTVEVGSPQGPDRHEMFVDETNTDLDEGESASAYQTRLRGIGTDKLAENLMINTVDLEIAPEGFGTRFWLGDIVTCILDDGTKLLSRVTGFTETSQRNSTTLEIKIGTPIVKRRVV